MAWHSLHDLLQPIHGIPVFMTVSWCLWWAGLLDWSLYLDQEQMITSALVTLLVLQGNVSCHSSIRNQIRLATSSKFNKGIVIIIIRGLIKSDRLTPTGSYSQQKKIWMKRKHKPIQFRMSDPRTTRWIDPVKWSSNNNRFEYTIDNSNTAQQVDKNRRCDYLRGGKLPVYWGVPTNRIKLDLRCYIVKLRIQGCRYWV